MNRLHPQIWELIVKSYRYAHGGDYLPNLLQALPLSVEFKCVGASNVSGIDGSRDSCEDIENFLRSLPLEDGLKVIRDALSDADIRKIQFDNWNSYGDYVKYWRGRIITCLESSGIKFDEETKSFYTVKGESLVLNELAVQLQFLSLKFDDPFYEDLKNEINRTFKFRAFTATYMLCRKLIENLVIDVLRLKFPQNVHGNLTLYFRTDGGGRFHDFTILLKNLEEKIEYFGVDKQIIARFLLMVKIFRPQSNSNAHSIIIIG